MNVQSKAGALVATAAILLAVQSALAVDVKVDFEKSVDFKSLRTWGWNPNGPGEVRMGRTPDDDPDQMRKRVEPVIVDAVTTGMRERGLEFAANSPDVFVTYFLLLSTSSSAQTIGQFLGPHVWSVPPFLASTQSLEVMNQGSLLLDVSAKGQIVWRGLADAKIKTDADMKRREAVLREAVRDLLRKYPKRS